MADDGSKSLASATSVDEDDALQRLEQLFKWYTEQYQDPQNHDWSTSLVQNLSIVSHSASPPHPRVTFRFTVQPGHANLAGNLHGGCTSTLFDICTSLLLRFVSRPGFWQNTGVSRTLNVTYLRPAPVGAIVDVECEVVHAGQRLCSLRGVMRAATSDGTKGPVLAVCEHGKVNTDPPVEKL
ncbi:Thioesterase/thiol ester dehydrase-isomerase [Nemania serpens]|nr:Thioesterase/thiol ester dehydrase-isomerase [Nemania serpens]